MIRKPVVSGKFYPQTENSLNKMLAKMIDPSLTKEEVIGLVLPHAGYIYSGYVAGATISRADIKKTAIILGTDHTGMGSPFSIITKGSWFTPLGEVKIDTEIAESILRGSSILKEDELSHLYEHSIEVQLPFLQYIRKDIKIVPVNISRAELKELQQLAIEIAEGFKKVGRSGIFIASTDMTHYEPREVAERNDKMAIEAMLALDEERLFTVVEKNNISMCGLSPTCTLIKICKTLDAGHATLVKYQTSGDTTGDYSSVVGYAGIMIW